MLFLCAFGFFALSPSLFLAHVPENATTIVSGEAKLNRILGCKHNIILFFGIFLALSLFLYLSFLLLRCMWVFVPDEFRRRTTFMAQNKFYCSFGGVCCCFFFVLPVLAAAWWVILLAVRSHSTTFIGQSIRISLEYQTRYIVRNCHPCWFWGFINRIICTMFLHFVKENITNPCFHRFSEK